MLSGTRSSVTRRSSGHSQSGLRRQMAIVRTAKATPVKSMYWARCFVGKIHRVSLLVDSDAPSIPDMGHQVPTLTIDVLKPKAEIDRVAVSRRQVDSGGVSEAVMAQHHIAGLRHQLRRLTKRDARHAVPQCLGSMLAEVSF